MDNHRQYIDNASYSNASTMHTAGKVKDVGSNFNFCLRLVSLFHPDLGYRVHRTSTLHLQWIFTPYRPLRPRVGSRLCRTASFHSHPDVHIQLLPCSQNSACPNAVVHEITNQTSVPDRPFIHVIRGCNRSFPNASRHESTIFFLILVAQQSIMLYTILNPPQSTWNQHHEDPADSRLTWSI